MCPDLYAGAMSLTRIRPATVAGAAVLTLLTGGVLGGCSVSRDDSPRSQGGSTSASDPSQSPTPTPSESATPTPTPSPSATPSGTPAPTVTASASPTSAPATTPTAALLTAAELPQLNSTSRWTQGRTGNAGTDPFGLCQKFDLLSIGALEAVQRSFTSGENTAGQQVAEFPDAQNAVRAGKVIGAWQRDCAGRVPGTSVKVRPFNEVSVSAGRGSYYLVSYERRGQGHFHSLGLVVSGTRLTLLTMDHPGQDHDYDPGKDPMELAVKAAAARLG